MRPLNSPAFGGLLLSAILAGFSWLSSNSRAEYTATLLSDGAATRSVLVGEEFELDVQLTSNAADQISSADLRVEFSSPGVRLVGYEWSNPFVSAGEDDASVPASSALPASITADLVPDGPKSTNRADIFFSNLTTDPAGFREGRLLRLRLVVPADFTGLDTVRVQIVPESFGDGFVVIPAKVGPAFSLHVRPLNGQAPSALSITRRDAALLLSWPQNIERAKLQAASQPNGPWADVAEQPQLVDGLNVVQLSAPVNVQRRFFRLQPQ